MADKHYDFSGWATRYGVACSDGRTIMPGAFEAMDGETVPLVWGHDHNGPKTILGKALLHNTPEGIYMEGSFNNTDDAQSAKEGVAHGDIRYLSIHANRLKQQVGNVLNGIIREVSLVPFGAANPGAFIDNAVLQHADGTYDLVDDEAVIFFGDEIECYHADKEDDVADENKKEKKPQDEGSDKTVQDVLDEMDDDQLAVVNYMMEQAVKKATGKSDDDDNDEEDEEDEVEHSYYEGGEDSMKYNTFENGETRSDVLTHSDQKSILEMAKDSRYGTFKNAMKAFEEENELMHDGGDPAPYPSNMATGGFDNTTVIDSYGRTSFTAILPEFKDIHPGMPPELITNDQGWINVVMSKTHKSPFSRIRTGQVDIRGLEDLRAKGYEKGKQKQLTGQIVIARRETEPQTIYVRNELHRDDITDITDFDIVQYLYNIDKLQLNEELARAIMLGDGRDAADQDKIKEDHIRPIWTDDELFTIHRTLDLDAARAELQGTETGSYFGDNYVTAEAMINAVLYAREDFRGTGQPDMFITPHMLNVMLLARDRNGRRIYSGRNELASALNVGNIYTAEQFVNKTRVAGSGASAVTKKLLGIIVNLADYAVGSTKGGQVTHFTDFDLEFNKERSLLETRVSGALTKIKSAIVIEENVTE